MSLKTSALNFLTLGRRLIGNPFLAIILALAALAALSGLIVSPSLESLLFVPCLIAIVLALVVMFARHPSGLGALAVFAIAALGLGLTMWIGTEWGRSAPDAVLPRTTWIAEATGWLLMLYLAAVVTYAGAVAQLLRAPFPRDRQWIFVVFGPASLVLALYHAIALLDAYNYPG